ncbi:MAG TPA: hypothetical protein P5513_04975 [Candidatus Diapherotrites archaeon]|nr:hypothetical protein [Candidatus Diapherotrites archaeon]
MKYSQFIEFKKILEYNNVSIEDWKINPDMELIKEEEDEDNLDTKE